MIQNSKQADQTMTTHKYKNLMFRNHLQISWRAGLYTVVPVLLFAFLGKTLDSILQTLPLFLIIGCLFGFILGLYIVYRSISSLIKNT